MVYALAILMLFLRVLSEVNVPCVHEVIQSDSRTIKARSGAPG